MLNKFLQSKIFHLACNYIVWFACVLSASQHQVYFGFGTAVVISYGQYWVYLKKQQELPLIIPSKNVALFSLWLTVLGIITDSIFLHSNIILFTANPFNISPLWMWGIWLNFAVTLYCCANTWFASRYFYILLPPLCFIGFYCAYYAGAALGAAKVTRGSTSLIIIALVYSLIIPLAILIFSYLFKKPNRDFNNA